MSSGAQRRPGLVLAVFGIGLVLWTGWLVHGLLLSITIAGFLAVLFAPAQRWLERKLGNRRIPIAFLLTTVALLVVVVPLVFMFFLLVQQVSDAMTTLQDSIGKDGVVKLFEGTLPPSAMHMVRQLQHIVPIPAAKIQEQLTALAQRLPKALGLIVGLSLRSWIHFLFLGLALFYFFLDGDKFVAFLREISPFEPHHTKAFIREFDNVAWAMVFGSSISALIGALACVLGFWAMKVPNPLFWGVLTGLFTLAPGIGCALIYVPLAAGLAIMGHEIQALGVAIFCSITLVIINDNVVRPLLVEQKLRLHPFIILLSIFGGVEAYGVPGLFVGPLVAAMAVTVLRIYRQEHTSRAAWSTEPTDLKIGKAG